MIKKLDLGNIQEIDKIYPLVQQLRPKLTLNTFRDDIEKMKSEKYELWVYEIDEKYLGAIGLREYTDFVRGQHLYVDDLVVDAEMRSQKIGAKLLRFAEEETRLRELPSLRLSCALENVRAARFYEKQSWTKRSAVFVKGIA